MKGITKVQCAACKWMRMLGLAGLLLCLLANAAWAQKKRAKERYAPVLSEIRNAIMSGESEKADQQLTRLLQHAQATHDTDLVVLAQIGLINTHITHTPYVDSVLDAMIPLARALGQPDYLSEYYLDKAVVHSFYMDYATQILYVDSALAIAIQGDDTLNMAYAYTELGNVYGNIREFRKAREAHHRASGLFRILKLGDMLGYTLRNEGEALLNLGEADSAIRYFDESLALWEQFHHDIQIGLTLGFLGHAYSAKKDFGAAEGYFQRAGKILWEDRSMYSDMAAAIVKRQLARHHLAAGQPGAAMNAAIDSYRIADSLGLGDDLIQALEAVMDAAMVEQPGAALYWKALLDAQRKAFETQKTRAVIAYERKFQVNEKEKEILKLDQQVKEASLRAERTRFWIVLMAAIVALVALLLLVLSMRARERSRREVEALNRKALQLQINPHFFFNVLNSINQYIGENEQQQAKYYLAKFARLMRLSLENSQFERVGLGQELDLVEAYLRLEQLRRDSFDIEIEASEEIRSQRIPPMMLQPLVENSVVHAFPDAMPKRGLIRIRASMAAPFLNLEISDNGLGIRPESNSNAKESAEKSALALRILTQRLRLHGRAKGQIEFAALDASQTEYPGTMIRMQIPLNL